MKSDIDDMHYYLVESVKQLKPKDIVNFQNTEEWVSYFLPKTTKVFGRAFLKEIFDSENDRLLVLMGHLYLENILVEIIKHKFKNIDKLEKSGITNSFYKKVKLLESQNYLSEDIVTDIIFINEIRNKFVHNLKYTLDEIDIFRFFHMTRFRDYLEIKNKKARMAFNKLLIKLTFMYLLFKLSKKHRFIHLMNV